MSNRPFDPVAFATHVKTEVDGVLRRLLKPMLERIERLEAELADARSVKYCGVWRQQHYKKGSFVTHAGSVWYANCDTTQRPTESTADWTLAVKRGRDASR